MNAVAVPPNATVWYVDDSRRARCIVRRRLARSGLRVQTIRDEPAEVDKMIQAASADDVFLLDVMLRGLPTVGDGVEIYARLLRQFSRVKALFLTAYPAAAERLAAGRGLRIDPAKFVGKGRDEALLEKRVLDEARQPSTGRQERGDTHTGQRSVFAITEAVSPELGQSKTTSASAPAGIRKRKSLGLLALRCLASGVVLSVLAALLGLSSSLVWCGIGALGGLSSVLFLLLQASDPHAGLPARIACFAGGLILFFEMVVMCFLLLTTGGG